MAATKVLQWPWPSHPQKIRTCIALRGYPFPDSLCCGALLNGSFLIRTETSSRFIAFTFENTQFERTRRRNRRFCSQEHACGDNGDEIDGNGGLTRPHNHSVSAPKLRKDNEGLPCDRLHNARAGLPLDRSNCSSAQWEADGSSQSKNLPSFRQPSLVENVSLAIKEPLYEVLEVTPNGATFEKTISRRQLLKSSGLRLRDIRSVDPSLSVTNSMPSLLIRDHAILLNLGSLRAIATPESVLIFDHKSIGAQAFLEVLEPRVLSESSYLKMMPFELEVIEAALLSRTQRLERRLMEVEPRVLSLLEILPNRLTANVLEELRVSKQALVELGSKAGALRQMLLDLLEDPQEIRRMSVMGRSCTIGKEDGSIQCADASDKQLVDEEAEEMEMLLDNYLLRCESFHGQAERLLEYAKEMEDSIAVNLSSRRLEVSRLELLLQVGTFCAALGALIAGIFGMNLRSYLEESMLAFWLTTCGIIFGGIILFLIMHNYLKQRKIL